MTPKVDGYIRKNKRWQAELTALRQILLACDLVEDIKWRVPCYTFNDANVALLGAFKEACVITFVKGALIEDAHGLLVKPGENTQSARMIRFQDVNQIVAAHRAIKDFVDQAVAIERSGRKVAFKKISEFTVPAEFQARLDATPALRDAFAALTPGRQRAYLMHFGSAKQSATRAGRVEKCLSKILSGKGLDDE